MATVTVTVNNPTRTRKWGWGWSCTPTGRDAYSIAMPRQPDYIGTLRQVREAIRNDRTYRSVRSGGTFTNQAWFYDGKRIVNRHEFTHWLDFILSPGHGADPITLVLEEPDDEAE